MTDPDPLQQEMAELAQRHVESARSWYGLSFDYSPASVQLADVVIAAFHPNGTTQPATVAAYGAYFGEVVRRSLGGTWISSDADEPPYLNGVGGTAIVLPFEWARQRFLNPADNRVSDQFRALLVSLGKATLLGSGTPESGAQPSLFGGKPVGEESRPLDDPANLLPASVLIVFLLVAAADGRVSTRELRALKQELKNPPENANRLYREVLQQVEERRQELSSLLPVTGQAELLLHLAKLRESLDADHASDADGYCDSLIQLGRTVACAAAGWRGFFRSRIDRQAASVLSAIKYVLRRESADEQ